MYLCTLVYTCIHIAGIIYYILQSSKVCETERLGEFPRALTSQAFHGYAGQRTERERERDGFAARRDSACRGHAAQCAASAEEGSGSRQLRSQRYCLARERERESSSGDGGEQ